MTRRHFAFIALALAAALPGCWASPGPIDAAAWEPPPAPPSVGALAPTNDLERAVIIAKGQLSMPEDVTVDPADPSGVMYAGVADGRIVKIAAEPGAQAKVSTFATTDGTPLGLKFDGKHNLIACVPGRGLLSINPSGVVRVLADGSGGRPFRFINDVDVAPDGTIYFTESHTKFSVEGVGPVWAITEGRADGRLYAYNPATSVVRELLGGLYFANGCTLTSDGASVLVAETGRYRIRRLWLRGPKAGTDEVFAEVPGIPDGIMGDGKGNIWVALVPRDPMLDVLGPHPWLRNIVARLPESVLIGMASGGSLGWVAAYGEDGLPRRSLQDATGRFKGGIANVTPIGNRLYLGTKWGDYVAVLPL